MNQAQLEKVTEYVIEHLDHAGDSSLFWRPDSRGYTVNLEEAGRYTEEEAKRIVSGRPEVDVAIPLGEVQLQTVQTVPRDRTHNLTCVFTPKNMIPHRVMLRKRNGAVVDVTGKPLDQVF